MRSDVTRMANDLPAARPAADPDRFVRITSGTTIATLVDAVMRGEPYIALTGVPGCGKTTAAAVIRDELISRSVRVLSVSQRTGGTLGLPDIASQLVGEPPDSGDQDHIEQLFAILTAHVSIESRVVLIIDDAELLQTNALEYLRLLSSMTAAPALQLLFVGRPEFWNLSAHAASSQFKQRITGRWELGRLNEAMTRTFINDLLSSNDPSIQHVLDPGSLDALARHSEGLFGRIVALISLARTIQQEGGEPHRRQKDVACTTPPPCPLPQGEGEYSSPAPSYPDAYGGEPRLTVCLIEDAAMRLQAEPLTLGRVGTASPPHEAPAPSVASGPTHLATSADQPEAPLESDALTGAEANAGGRLNVELQFASPTLPLPDTARLSPSEGLFVGDADGEAIIGPIIANRSPRRRFYLYAACVALVLGTGASVMHWQASMGRPNALGPPLRPDVIAATEVSASAGPAVDGGQTSGASHEQVSPPVGSAELPAPQSSLSQSVVMTAMGAPPAAALPSAASQTDPLNAAPTTNAPDPHGTNAAQAPASEVPTESAVAVPAQAQTLPDGPATASAATTTVTAAAEPEAAAASAEPATGTPTVQGSAQASVIPADHLAPQGANSAASTSGASATGRGSDVAAAAMSPAAQDTPSTQAGIGPADQRGDQPTPPTPPPNRAADRSPEPPGSADTSATRPATAAGETARTPAVPTPRQPPRTPTEAKQAMSDYVRRGDAMLAIKDISAARKFYEMAANAGNAQAAMALARTYDPAFLSQLQVIGLQPDLASAVIWYRKAAALGAPDAPARLLALGATAGR